MLRAAGMSGKLAPRGNDVEVGELSAAEAACSPMERRFCYWLMNLPPKRGFRVQAARLAGYGKASTPHTLNSIAQDLLSKQRVVALISEITSKQIRSAA